MDNDSFKRNHFLDVTLEVLDDGLVKTSRYQKEGYAPQYLSFHSQHPMHNKLGIWMSQLARYLLLNSTAEGNYADMRCLKKALIARGYPAMALPEKQFSREERKCRLLKLLQRSRLHSPNERQSNHNIVFHTMYCSLIGRLRLKHQGICLRESLDSAALHCLNLVVANRANPNVFLLPYRMNVPVGG